MTAKESSGKELIDMPINNPGETVAAIDLTRQHLSHLVTVTDHTGEQVTGLLHRIELDAIPGRRVQVRVAAPKSNPGIGGRWSIAADYRFLDPDSQVQVGEPVPDWEEPGCPPRIH